MTETEITQRIRVALAKVQGVTIWRNNSGRLEDRTGRWVTYGLGVGSADLVGLVACQWEGLVNRAGDAATVGRFFALEVKVPGRDKAHATDDQERWRSVVRSLGGFCAVVHSADEAIAAVARCRSGALE